MNEVGGRLGSSPFLSTQKASWRYLARMLALLLPAFFFALVTSGEVPQKKNVLIISEVGPSHPAISSIMQQILAGVQKTHAHDVEFYFESLDLVSFSNGPSGEEASDWLTKKYGSQKVDVVVAVGPGAVNFLSDHAQAMFSEVPIVICGASADQLSNPRLDSRFTGTWLSLEPEKTLEVALRLFPDTRQVYVVGGSSHFDKVVLLLTRARLSSFNNKVEIHYLAEMEMGKLLGQLQNLPEHSIELYTSFFQDSAGTRFLNATKALPMIATASNAPDFGMSDTYVGHGIVGGYVMPFEQQGKATAQIVSELLAGKKAQDLPMETLPGVYMFDWRELQQWHIPVSSLPSGSVVLFREPGLWERTRWMWITAFLVMFGLSSIVVYLYYNHRQLKISKERQSQLSGMLINAEEHERSRVASELHDDYSQRLALLALGLENAADTLPPSAQETNRQLHELVNSASELGADLHTLSHSLHSSTLERLGLVPGVSSFCKEFQAQHGVHVEFTHNEIPQSLHPDIALCAFRIIQEGLRNVSKHSGADKAQVRVHGEGKGLVVSVSDHGSGFDTRKLGKKEGLGIPSMEERVHLMDGHFEIHSEPGKGTQLEAWLPLEKVSGQGAG
jgi:signal transduction histidine kinase